MDQPDKVANPARGQLNKLIFPCPRMCLRIWSRETGLAVPSRVSLFILHTKAEFGAYLRDSSRVPQRRPCLFILNHHTPSGQSRVYRVTQLRTDGVRCRESAGTGPVNLRGSSERVLPWQVTIDQLICASLSHTHY